MNLCSGHESSECQKEEPKVHIDQVKAEIDDLLAWTTESQIDFHVEDEIFLKNCGCEFMLALKLSV